MIIKQKRTYGIFIKVCAKVRRIIRWCTLCRIPGKTAGRSRDQRISGYTATVIRLNYLMDNSDKAKIENLIRIRKRAHTYFSERSQVYASFLDLEKNTYKDDKLGKMQKELIATGISVVINCESCMEWHIKQALDCGATEDQILEAVEVGIEMGGGPATASARFVMNVMEYYFNSAK